MILEGSKSGGKYFCNTFRSDMLGYDQEIFGCEVKLFCKCDGKMVDS